MKELIADFVYSLQRRSAALLLYQSVLTEDVGRDFLQLLQALGEVLPQATSYAVDYAASKVSESNIASELSNLSDLNSGDLKISDLKIGDRKDRNTQSIDRANEYEASPAYRRQQLNCLRAYGKWFHELAILNQGWQDYLINRILIDDNPFSRQAQILDFAEIPAALIAATKQDLQVLQSLYSCSGDRLSKWVQTAANLAEAPAAWHDEDGGATSRSQTPANSQSLQQLKTKLQQSHNWADLLPEIAAYYRRFGTGLFAQYRAFRWQSGQMVGIAHPDPISIDTLVGYESQKQALLQNTEALLTGYPALNVLLYGSRGSGKSSLVKSLLQLYGDRGLRLIEVAKSELRDLPIVTEKLWHLPQKFIIFVDDLSFEEDENDYKALKALLEGNLTTKPPNVVVYATSNRRHLIREFFGDRPRPKDGDEIHAWDTVQEKMSLSDRFGLIMTFIPADQDTYLEIVRHLADRAGINLNTEELEYRALQWATNHSGRSGRTAQQFIDFAIANNLKAN